ncbi:MAG: hypothetical protein QOI88_544 [Gammaproteobacteria bacterium]|nr:hypothetical protein [Gammaproteobacteria bacterium]
MPRGFAAWRARSTPCAKRSTIVTSTQLTLSSRRDIAVLLQMRFEKGIERAQHLRAGFRSREPVVLTFEGVDLHIFPGRAQCTDQSLGLIIGHHAIAGAVNNENRNVDALDGVDGRLGAETRFIRRTNSSFPKGLCRGNHTVV